MSDQHSPVIKNLIQCQYFGIGKKTYVTIHKYDENGTLQTLYMNEHELENVIEKLKNIERQLKSLR